MIWLRQQEHLQCLVTISGRKSSSLLKLYKWIYVQNWRQQGTSKKQKYLVYPTVKSWKVFNCNWWLCWVEMVHPMNTFKYESVNWSACVSQTHLIFLKHNLQFIWLSCTSGTYFACIVYADSKEKSERFVMKNQKPSCIMLTLFLCWKIIIKTLFVNH